MFRWFKKETVIGPALEVDIHSHLLPGIDDGAKSLEEAERIIVSFSKLGYRKLVTTPHIMSDAYQNTPHIIHEKLALLNAHLHRQNITVEVEAAAEYYVDEKLLKMLASDEPLLTFGNRYLLFETNFMNEPFNLKEFIFNATTKGYKPVLAHPERYLYLQDNLSKAEDLLNRGVLFQVNISSLTGLYSKMAQLTAHKLIDRGWIHWLGSDCHQLQHVALIEEARRSKYFRKALTLPLLNNTLS